MAENYPEICTANTKMEFIIANTAEYYAGRKVIIWGNYKTGTQVSRRLYAELNIEPEFYVDSDENKADGEKCFLPEVLDAKADTYYVVIPLRYHDSVKETLVQYGYLKNKDYYYFDDCIMQQKDGYYEDNHGNKVVGKYSGKGIFYFGGCHSSVEIGDNVRLNKTQIDVGHHSVLSIGDASNLNDVTIKMGNGAECFIGNATTMFRVSMDIRANSYWHSGIRCMFTCDFGFGKHSILVRYGGRCTIGNNCLLLDGLVMTLDGGTIDIGNDCMFSHDVVLRSTDAHSLFDVLSGENINSTPDICKARRIEIGNHVWIGARSFILYNTVLRDGAVIGAQSLVKGYVPNNAIAAGSPARVIRENIAWCRKFGSGNISDCGEEYVNLTITEE